MKPLPSNEFDVWQSKTLLIMSLLKEAHAKGQRRKVTREKNLRTRGILGFFSAANHDY
jgi:hypothetical protein